MRETVKTMRVRLRSEEQKHRFEISKKDERIAQLEASNTEMDRQLRYAKEAKDNTESNLRTEIRRLECIVIGQAAKAVGR